MDNEKSHISARKILLLSISLEELKEVIREVFKEELKPLEEQEELLDFKEAYKFLKCSASTLNRWKAQGKVLYRRKGKRIYFLKSELIDSLDETITHRIHSL